LDNIHKDHIHKIKNVKVWALNKKFVKTNKLEQIGLTLRTSQTFLEYVDNF